MVTCEIKQKQNTETILKRFRIVLELFQVISIGLFIRMSKNMQILKLDQNGPSSSSRMQMGGKILT